VLSSLGKVALSAITTTRSIKDHRGKEGEGCLNALQLATRCSSRSYLIVNCHGVMGHLCLFNKKVWSINVV